MIRRRIASHVLAALLAAVAWRATAQDPVPNVNGYVTLANGYWKRGLSQNDGASLQVGIDYEHHSGLFVGAWAANVEFAQEISYQQPREIEANTYIGYQRRVETWSWNVAVGRYFYPDTAVSYDYDELSMTFGFRDRVFYTAQYADGYYDRPRSSLNQELSVAFPLRGDFEVSGTLGDFTIADGGPDITHWNVGVSKLVRRFAFDLRYYDGNQGSPTFLGDPAANHYILSVSYALRGRQPRT